MLRSDAVSGYLVLGMRKTLFDGGFHGVDHSYMSFKIATRTKICKDLRKDQGMGRVAANTKRFK